jgi:predicted permease
MLSKIGFFAFIIGLILCIIGGFIPSWLDNAAIIVILIILGLIVGFLNITSKEITLFLVATIALIVTGRVFGALTILGIGEYLDRALTLVATLMAPAAVVAAIKALWAVGKPGEATK